MQTDRSASIHLDHTSALMAMVVSAQMVFAMRVGFDLMLASAEVTFVTSLSDGLQTKIKNEFLMQKAERESF